MAADVAAMTSIIGVIPLVLAAILIAAAWYALSLIPDRSSMLGTNIGE